MITESGNILLDYIGLSRQVAMIEKGTAEFPTAPDSSQTANAPPSLLLDKR